MNDDTAPDVLGHFAKLVPMKRVGRPEEAAELGHSCVRTG
jgi:3-oxoacyl-[acyl-carrier protein] reductase